VADVLLAEGAVDQRRHVVGRAPDEVAREALENGRGGRLVGRDGALADADGAVVRGRLDEVDREVLADAVRPVVGDAERQEQRADADGGDGGHRARAYLPARREDCMAGARGRMRG
jgi:hypothetical protein